MVGALAYAGASWILFDKASAVEAHCGTFADGSPRFAEYTPASFGTAGISDAFTAGGFDTAPYAMPDYQEVRFESRDGVSLAAWWVPADRPDAAAVILVHGKGSCRHDPVILLPAGMLHRNGFAVLLVDIRDMGDSEVLDGRYSGGTQEYMDVLGAWDWLRARGLPAESDRAARRIERRLHGGDRRRRGAGHRRHLGGQWLLGHVHGHPRGGPLPGLPGDPHGRRDVVGSALRDRPRRAPPDRRRRQDRDAAPGDRPRDLRRSSPAAPRPRLRPGAGGDRRPRPARTSTRGSSLVPSTSRPPSRRRRSTSGARSPSSRTRWATPGRPDGRADPRV